MRLGDVFDIQSGSTPSRQNFYYWENTSIYWVKTTDLNNNFISDTEEKISEIGLKESSCKVYPKNTILIAMYGGFNQIGRTGILQIEAATNQAISALLPSTKANSLFVNNILICYRNKWKNIAISSRKDPNITKRDIENFKIPLPPLDEQKKIAEILSTWDEAINLTINLIESKKQFKKALMQNLLTAKIRFPQFQDEWEETKLGKILKERKTYQNKGFDLEHVSLTKDGVVPKSERYDRDFLVKDDNKQYKITKLNDICYNPANLKFGVICKNTYGNGIFSPIYVTFECCNELDNNFAGFCLTQNDFIQKVRKFEEGTVYERMAVGPDDFLRFKIKLPNLNEQQKIAEVLTACDDEINLLNLKLENLKKQKQGLMQKLLSGKVRVK